MAALEYGGGTHDWEDIVDGVQSGRMQLWPSTKSCIVTEIVVYPKKRLLNIFLAGGELEQILDMDDDVKAWAKQQGCTGAMMSGRKGWERPLKPLGWDVLQVHYQKEI